MTARETALEIMFGVDHEDRADIVVLIEQAISAAVAEEREACATLLDNADVEPYCGFQLTELARQIRARSTAAEGGTE